MPASGLQLDEWLARLESYSPYEIDLGLERVQQMLQRLALVMPPTVIHVAGTNGKGSSVAILDAILRKSGQTVGCYTSPHLVNYNERVCIDGAAVADDELVSAFEVVEAQRNGLPLTYFEFGTLAALVIFAQRAIDIAILEVGMGGRLDAVNAVEPTVGLITNIALDHCDWLGDNVEAIAAEKAGIMRPGKPVVYAAGHPPATIEATASALGARLYIGNRDYHWLLADDTWSWQCPGVTLKGLQRPSLAGTIQVQNAAGALMALAAAGYTHLLRESVINSALADIHLPGRAQIVADRFVLDVAHNPDAASMLATTVKDIRSGRAAVTILGMLNDKDVEAVVNALDGLTDHWIAVTTDSPRAIAADELSQRIQGVTHRPCRSSPSMAAAIAHAAELCDDDATILITGSFYTVGAALVILAAAGNEHG